MERRSAVLEGKVGQGKVRHALYDPARSCPARPLPPLPLPPWGSCRPALPFRMGRTFRARQGLPVAAPSQSPVPSPPSAPPVPSTSYPPPPSPAHAMLEPTIPASASEAQTPEPSNRILVAASEERSQLYYCTGTSTIVSFAPPPPPPQSNSSACHLSLPLHTLPSLHHTPLLPLPVDRHGCWRLGPIYLPICCVCC